MAVKAASDAFRPCLEDRVSYGAEKAAAKAVPSASGVTSDQLLADDFLSGERAAFETIAQWIRLAAGRHRARLHSEWDDVVQDLLLAVTAVLRDGGFRGDSSLRTFVWRLAHYRCLNRIRDAARRSESELEEKANQIADPKSPVLDRMLKRESENLLLRFLDSVSEDCQRLWRLILAGRSYREMSQEIGVSEGVLRVRVLRCRKKAVGQWKIWLDSVDG